MESNVQSYRKKNNYNIVTQKRPHLLEKNSLLVKPFEDNFVTPDELAYGNLSKKDFELLAQDREYFKSIGKQFKEMKLLKHKHLDKVIENEDNKESVKKARLVSLDYKYKDNESYQKVDVPENPNYNLKKLENKKFEIEILRNQKKPYIPKNPKKTLPYNIKYEAYEDNKKSNNKQKIELRQEKHKKFEIAQKEFILKKLVIVFY